MIRGTLLVALLAAVPRFLGPPVKKGDGGMPDAGGAPGAALRPGDSVPAFAAELEENARFVLVVFGQVEPALTNVYTKYKKDGLQAVAFGAVDAPFPARPDPGRVIERSYRGDEDDAPRYFVVGRDGVLRFAASNAAALDRELERALRP